MIFPFFQQYLQLFKPYSETEDRFRKREENNSQSFSPIPCIQKSPSAKIFFAKGPFILFINIISSAPAVFRLLLTIRPLIRIS